MPPMEVSVRDALTSQNWGHTSGPDVATTPARLDIAVDAVACTFDDVMLDWAIAEVLSPDSWHDFYRTLGAPFRERVAKSRGQNLFAADRALLLEAVQYVRQPLIVDECAITKLWKFWKVSVDATELASYAIIHLYRARYGGMSFGEFAAAVRDHPFDTEIRTRASVLAMLELARRGVKFPGSPIAVMGSQTDAPLLIEGYKRSMVALLSGAPSLDIYFCAPNDPAINRPEASN
jgi:hypothetical protein